jgi:hypothetical protein
MLYNREQTLLEHTAGDSLRVWGIGIEKDESTRRDELASGRRRRRGSGQNQMRSGSTAPLSSPPTAFRSALALAQAPVQVSPLACPPASLVTGEFVVFRFLLALNQGRVCHLVFDSSRGFANICFAG